jgi:hypothetical protein
MTDMDISDSNTVNFRPEEDMVITRVSKVIVPVTDQQAALDFWTACMGFHVVSDDKYGNERWIEIKPPVKSC